MTPVSPARNAGRRRPERFRRLLSAALLTALLLPASGCELLLEEVIPAAHRASRPDYHPGQALVVHDGVILRIQAQRYGKNPPLLIWMEVDPEDRTFALRPSDLEIVFEGQATRPYGFYGPGVGGPADFHLQCGEPSEHQPRHDDHMRYDDCFNCSGLGMYRLPEESVPVHGPTCFVMLYDLALRPFHEFDLGLGGVRRHGRSAELEAVRVSSFLTGRGFKRRNRKWRKQAGLDDEDGT